MGEIILLQRWRKKPIFHTCGALTLGVSFLFWIASLIISTSVISQDLSVFHIAGSRTSFLPGVTESFQYPALTGVLSWVLAMFPLEFSPLIWIVGFVVPASFITIFLLSRVAINRNEWIAGTSFFFAASGSLSIAFFQRVEPLVFPFLIGGFLALRMRREFLAGVLFAFGGLLKFWSFAYAFIFLALKKARIFIPSGIVLFLSLATLAIPTVFLGSWMVFGSGRGYQVESFVALPGLWANQVLPDAPYKVATDPTSLSVEIYGPFLGIFHILLAMAIAGSIMWVLWVSKEKMKIVLDNPQGYLSELILTFLGAVSVGMLIALPVLSPQYVAWLFPIIMLGLSQGFMKREAYLIIGVSLLSTIVYPFFYSELVEGELLPLFLLTLRNILLLFLYLYWLKKVIILVKDQEHNAPALSDTDHSNPLPENSSNQAAY